MNVKKIKLICLKKAVKTCKDKSIKDVLFAAQTYYEFIDGVSSKDRLIREIKLISSPNSDINGEELEIHVGRKIIDFVKSNP